MKHIRIAILILCALLTASCKKSDAPKPTAPIELHVLAFAEHIPADLIRNFTEETQVKVSLNTVTSNEAMQSKLSSDATKYDVIQAPESSVEALIKMNRLASLESQNIAGLANIAPEMKNLPFDPGNKFTVPYTSGVIGIVYDAEKIKTPINGFKDVFKPEHARRIILPSDDRQILSCAMIAQGIPINDVTLENLAKVRPTLQQWAKLNSKSGPANPIADLQGGKADIAIMRSGDAALLMAGDKRFKFVVPAEGAVRYIDNLAIAADAPHKQAAEQFIDFCLRSELNAGNTPKFSQPNLQIPRDIGKAGADIEKMMTEIRGGG